MPRIRIAVGCHPHNAKDYDDALEAKLLDALRDTSVCAVGEIGLDYHYDMSPRDVQRAVFRRQIRVAKQADMPVLLHVREAHDDAFALLQEEGLPKAGVLLHCYNLDAAELSRWLEIGCYVAFGGPLTFKKSDYVREAATTVPLDRLLTETDSPFMTPEPMRGMTCEPAHTIFTAETLCECWDKTGNFERKEFLGQVFQNALTLLDREPTAWQKDGDNNA